MEASLASPTVKESFTTTLTSLPPELLADVAAHLPLGSLACFSLVSRFVREAVQPKLYHKVELRCDGATELQERRREAVRATLKLLGEDEKRCEMLRELDLREWAWMDDAETKDLAAVSRSARRLTALRLENSPSDLESYIPVFQPVWDAVLALPDLTRLACSGGPLVPLHLHRNSALRRLEITNYTMVPNEDGALPALHHLHLDNVGGFTEEWFAPKLLESLRVLTLANLDLAGAKVVLSLFTRRSEDDVQHSILQNLHTLVLDLGVLESRDTTFTIYLNLLTFSVELASLRSLEIHATGLDLDDVAALPSMVFKPGSNIKLQHLSLHGRNTGPSVCTRMAFENICKGISALPHLGTFDTNFTTGSAFGDISPLFARYGHKMMEPDQEAYRYIVSNPALCIVIVPEGMVYLNPCPLLVFLKYEGAVYEAPRLTLGWRSEVREFWE